jgi:hypothetical protein
MQEYPKCSIREHVEETNRRVRKDLGMRPGQAL